MASLTFVVDAKYLIDHVQEIKDLVYGGEIRLHMPTCTFENVEKTFQSSLLQQEAQKEPPSKKSVSKVSGRKEQQPLFDLNPRIAREFLSRFQSRSNQTVDDIVTFQLPGQQFTQWKNEEEKAIKAEQPPEQPPSSFAQALLRKLNIVEEESGPKAPAKPRLVAKDAAVNKTPWKYHKVPNIPSAGVPAAMKPLLSCMLWRLHEYENNPLKPQTFVLATGDQELITMAKKLGIPLKDVKELCAQVTERLKAQDTRNEVGQEEIRLGVKVKGNVILPSESKELSSKDNMHEKDKGIQEIIDIAEPMPHGSPTQPDALVGEPSPIITKDSESSLVVDELLKQDQPAEDFGVFKDLASVSTGECNVKDLLELTPSNAAFRDKATRDLTLPEIEASEIAKIPVSQPSPIKNATQPSKSTESMSEDEDSEVDIVVFKPKSRPGSSYIKRSLEATKPSPPKVFTQAVTQAISEGLHESQAEQPVRADPIKHEAALSNQVLPKEAVVLEPMAKQPTAVPRPQKARAPLSYTAALEIGLPKKAAVKPQPINPISSSQETKPVPTPLEPPVPQSSHLAVNSPRSRPQTPRGGHAQGQNGFQHQHRQHHNRPQTPRDPGNQFPQHQDHRYSKKQSPQRMRQPRTIHSRSPSGEPSQLPSAPAATETAVLPAPAPSDTLQRHPSGQSSSSSASSNKGNHRSPTEEPSNAHNHNRNRPKNHPAYPRFNQVSVKAQRVAQQQPTTTPIIIDADSFDRSSHVKPQFHAVQAHNLSAHNLNAHNVDMHAVNGQSQYAGMNGNGRLAGGRGATTGGRAMPRAGDGEVDFVLKSGTPRGRGRGTGRLWVP